MKPPFQPATHPPAAVRDNPALLLAWAMEQLRWRPADLAAELGCHRSLPRCWLALSARPQPVPQRVLDWMVVRAISARTFGPPRDWRSAGAGQSAVSRR